MNPKTVAHLAKAAEHLDHAATAYRDASKAHTAGNHHQAASHALAGHGHQLTRLITRERLTSRSRTSKVNNNTSK